MIKISDKEYKDTKRIKQGKMHLVAPFDELAQWISSTWNVVVLNVMYDYERNVHRPRLQIILEHESHLETFLSGVNFDLGKQNAISTKFLEIIGRDKTHRFDVDKLLVVFSAFAPLAMEEADSQISNREIKNLKKQIGNPDLWEISRFSVHVTFFFFTDDQVKRYENEGKKTLFAKMYFDLLKPHDEFGYFDEEIFVVNFDSK